MDQLNAILVETLDGSAPVSLDSCAELVHKQARQRGIRNIRLLLEAWNGSTNISDWILMDHPDVECYDHQGEVFVRRRLVKPNINNKRSRGSGDGERRTAARESSFSPLNAEQTQYEALVQAAGGARILCFGASGTGKTFLAVVNALRWLDLDDDINDKTLMLTRPDVDASGRHIEDDDLLCAPALEAVDFCKGKGAPTHSVHRHRLPLLLLSTHGRSSCRHR